MNRQMIIAGLKARPVRTSVSILAVALELVYAMWNSVQPREPVRARSLFVASEEHGDGSKGRTPRNRNCLSRAQWISASARYVSGGPITIVDMPGRVMDRTPALCCNASFSR
jgi:hypothetical protein